MELEELFLDKEICKDIDEAVKENRFEYISLLGKEIGFYTWVKIKDALYIGNFFIRKKFRDRNNLLHLRRYLTNKFPDVNIFYWHIDKGFIYYTREGNEIHFSNNSGSNQPSYT